ncbi:MAG TPA: chromosomal replication initiator protein DnaA [Opitutaceae bacterium]|jgi:chromosomal replication initiator protein|nr:chromosomal replication initiator protein DnaA [Opitutaceae bacterium]HOR23747.1 chromosomal replication initiator protein DnaA [Opitutaceae bacterium]HPK50335.1 chromosomal replication initiator protein DnaA [Opitutaceae bacterium]
MSTSTMLPSLWETVKCDFKGLFPEDVFHMWFEPMVCLESTEEQMTLGVPNDFAAIWIHDNYLDLITQRLRLTSGRMITVTLKKTDSAAAPQQESEPRTSIQETAGNARVRAHQRRATRAEGHAIASGSLNARNTFETFVVGSNNQMAHAAAMAVAQSPGQAYNPLFIYGDTGLGKTHLMHAIGHAILRHNPEAKIAYLSTEKFTNEFIEALQSQSLTRFRQRYRHVDVLLIDDVQFLAGKERIQEEFFHTFNELFESGKQIVLSSDRRASEIQKLEARLVSRFEWGLPADIQAPDVETRIAILRTKATSLKFDLPATVLNFIAQNVSKNIRRLEGALIKVASYANLTGKPIDLPTAEMLLQDVLIEQAQNLLTIEVIQKRVADHYQIRHSDMTSKRRPANIAIPRQIAMYLCRQLTKHSLQEIGDAFGGRDHGTVIHACKSVDNMLEQDTTVRGSIEYLKGQLAR